MTAQKQGLESKEVLRWKRGRGPNRGEGGERRRWQWRRVVVLALGLSVVLSLGVGSCKGQRCEEKKEGGGQGRGDKGKKKADDERGGGGISLKMRSTQGCGKPFTPQKIFAPKSLAGNPPRGFSWSHDGHFAFYLKGSEEDAKVLDLWRFDAKNQKSELLLTAATLSAKGKAQLTEEQRAAQERKRVRHHGITSFVGDKAGKGLLIPFSGYLYHFALDTKKLKRLVEKPGGELDPKPSPDGSKVAFVRKGDLYVLDVTTLEEKRLTQTGSKTLKNGVAEFVASEELDRHTGYWWSPKGDRIAYAEVDNSPVGVVKRPKYTKEGVKVVTQRYPTAGTANAKVRLGVVELASAKTTWVKMGEEGEFYLARVKWTPAGLSFQTLTRDAKRLSLRLADPASGTSRLVLQEKDDKYINVHDDLRPLEGKRAQKFLWSSEKDGDRQLYLGDWKTGSLTPLSTSPLFIQRVRGVDEKRGFVYASVPFKRGLELHLYRFPLDPKTAGSGTGSGTGSGEEKKKKPSGSASGLAPGSVKRITRKNGWHSVTMAPKARAYFDRFSDLSTPPQVRIHDAEGKVLDVLDENPAKEFRSHCRTESEWVTFPAKDGSKLNGLLLYPVGYQKGREYPAILYTYGGPHGRAAARRWSRMEAWHRYMTQFGVFVFLFDGRGTGYRGKRFEEKLYKAFGKVDVEDVEAAAQWIGKRPEVDAERLGVELWRLSHGDGPAQAR